ncbi:MAG: DUF6306 domain-containing protein [Kiloniellales bacterium]
MTRKGIETTKDDASASRMERSGEPGTYASPPCFMHELDPSHFGQMSSSEMLTLLNSLLEAERAGARGVGEISKRATSAESHSLLQSVAKDEATFCAMLTRHIVRLGGVPSTRTGAFYEKLAAADPGRAQLDLLNRGQGWVVRELRKALPKVGDEHLHKDLTEMLQVHQRNIEQCDSLDF